MKDENYLLTELAEILEVEISSLNKNTNFRRDIEYWDSLKGFSILVLLQDEFNVKISVDEFIVMSTIDDLTNEIKKQAVLRE